MKKIIKICVMLAVAVAAVGCYNDFDTPAPQKIYQDEDFSDLTLVSIAEVKQMFLDAYGTLEHTGDNSSWDDTKSLLIEEDIYIKGKVQSNDEEGNVYKSLYICDQTAAIEIKLGTGNYLKYPTGHFDPTTGTMASTWVYVKLKGLYLGNYRMMLSLGAGPSDSYNKCNEHKFYANSNIENPAVINQHVFRGEPTELVLGEDILEITNSNKEQFFGEANIDKLGRMVLIRDVTCEYGEVDGNIYPSWMDTNVRPVVSKYWYQWGFNEKIYPSAANLYGSILFSYVGLPSQTGKAGVYVVRSSGYARFAGKPIVKNKEKVDILGHLAIYAKWWADYATYQVTVNRFEDIMPKNGAEAYISTVEMNADKVSRDGYDLRGYNEAGEYNQNFDAYYTPSTEDGSEGDLE